MKKFSGSIQDSSIEEIVGQVQSIEGRNRTTPTIQTIEQKAYSHYHLYRHSNI